ncbi:MAG: carbohydrate binding domain-containing protein [Bryobacteraceae bacterium]
MRTTLTGVAVVLFLVCGAARADLITNGGFETGDFTGWTVTGANLLNVNYGISNIVPEDGVYCAWFSGSATGLTYLSQTIATVPGQLYDASVWISYTMKSATTNELQFWWGGIEELDGSAPSSMPWTSLSNQFTATSTSTTITFGFESQPSGWFAVDDLEVDPVPEPQAMILCGLGLGFVGLLRRASAR